MADSESIEPLSSNPEAETDSLARIRDLVTAPKPGETNRGPLPPPSEVLPEITPGLELATLGTTSPEVSAQGRRLLDDGCYLIRYVPAEPSEDEPFYEGTARMLAVGADGKRDPDGALKAGADLYCPDPDLYKRDPAKLSESDPTTWKRPKDADDGSSVPIFPRARYRYYLQATKILERVPDDESVSISFSVYGFKPHTPTEWPNPGRRWVCLQKVSPLGKNEYWAGNVLDESSGQIVGTLTLCWVSKYLRRATVAIHRVAGVNSFPGDSVLGKGSPPEAAWKAKFGEVGWALELDIKERPDLKPFGKNGTWTIGELQQVIFAMRIRRMVSAHGVPQSIKEAEQKVDEHLETMTQLEIQQAIPGLSTLPNPLDQQWFYQLLCVPKIEGFDRGVMFDTCGCDSENLPREGAAVTAKWKFGDDATNLLTNNPVLTAQADEIRRKWGPKILGKELQDVPEVYFRVAVHEIGHTMGLDHNFKNYGFMNTTDSIADDELEEQRDVLKSNLRAKQLSTFSQLLQDANLVGVPLQIQKANPFPGLIELDFQADDINQLRFGADIVVRPGTSFDNPGPLFEDAGPTIADGLQMEVSPLLDSVPFGAPVRINLKVTNTSSQPQSVPAGISLKMGVVSGSVVDPGGNERTFWPVKKWEDSDAGDVLAPYETRTYSETLLRASKNALFPMVGHHRVNVTASWDRNGRSVCLQGGTVVRITEALDDNHLAAALKILSTPDTLFSLAIGGDHLSDGNAAIQAAAGNPILKPHVAVVLAKLWLTSSRTKDPGAACDLIDDSIVLSFDEIDRITNLLWQEYQARKPVQNDRPSLRKAVACLQKKIIALRTAGSIDAYRVQRTLAMLGDLSKL